MAGNTSFCWMSRISLPVCWRSMPPIRLIPLYISRFPAGCLTSRVSYWSLAVRWAKSLARGMDQLGLRTPQQGETFEQAVTRRCRFELGVEISDIAPVHPAFRYRAVAPNGIVENEVCPVYAARVVSEVQPNDDEVMDYQWVDLATMLSALAATPWAFSPWMVLEAENRDARQALTDFVARLRG